MSEYIIITSIVFIAFAIRGMAGFGGTMLSISAMSLFIPRSEAVVMASLLEGAVSVPTTYKNFTVENFKLTFALIPGLVIGNLIGAFGLVKLDFNFDLIFAFLLILLALNFTFDLSKTKLIKPSFIMGGSVGLVSGLCGACFGINGPPIIAYLGQIEDKLKLRSCLLIVFGFDAIFRTALYFVIGKLNITLVILNLTFLIPLLLGTFLGGKLSSKFNDRTYKLFISVLLTTMSLLLLLKQIE